MHAVVWGVAGQSMDQLSSNRELHESQTKVRT